MENSKDSRNLETLLNQVANKKNFTVFSETKRLKSYHQKYKNSKQDPQAKGAYLGVLFEHYVTPLLIQVVAQNPQFKWLVPNRYHKKSLDTTKRRDRLAYDDQGEIILFDAIYPTTEVDGIIKIGKQIYLIEMKYNAKLTRNLVQKLHSRIRLWNVAYDRQVKLLLLMSKGILSQEMMDRLSSHSEIELIEVENFWPFQSSFEAKHSRIKYGKLKQYSKKLRKPSEIFSKIISFDNAREELKKSFIATMDKKLTPNEFFENNAKYVHLVGRIPLGVLHSKKDFSKYDPQNQRITKYLSQNIPSPVFAKFREASVRPEIIFLEKSSKQKNQRFYRCKFNFKSNSFFKGKKDVTKGKHSHHIAQQEVKNKKSFRITPEDLKNIIQTCKILSNHWEIISEYHKWECEIFPKT